MEAEIKKIKYEKNYKFFFNKMFIYQLFTSLSNLFETFINFSILVFFFQKWSVFDTPRHRDADASTKTRPKVYRCDNRQLDGFCGRIGLIN